MHSFWSDDQRDRLNQPHAIMSDYFCLIIIHITNMELNHGKDRLINEVMMMKIIVLFIAVIIFISTLSGCDGASLSTATPSPANPPITLDSGENSAGCAKSGFEMAIFSDKKIYKTTDAIKIWAMLEYVGKNDTVTIWHGDPYIVFSITDGKDFNSDGFVATVLTSTDLIRGELYRFDYQKSGGWDANDPNAGFWENFYKESDLSLPAGEYTVTALGDFSLTENVADSQSGLSCDLKIKVEA